MNYYAFLFFLFSLQCVCFWIGSKSAKTNSNQDDYFLAGKTVRFFPLMMTFLATQVGGGLILGSTEEAYNYGWWVLLYPLGASLGLLTLSFGLGEKMTRFKVSTIAQIFEVFYKSPTLKKFASFLSIFSLFLILMAQFIASKKFMVTVGVENPVWFNLFWIIVIAYTTVGGFKAVVATDVVQASFFVFSFIMALIYFVFFGNSLPLVNEPLDISLPSEKAYGWLFMPLLFMLIEQDMGQRCFAGENGKTISNATLWASIATILICCIPVYFGTLANQMGIAIPENGSVFMAVVEQLTNPIITALIACAILAAIISTADSLINAISSNLSQDFDFSFTKNKIKDAQLITASIAILGLFSSYLFTNIVDLLIFSYELSVYCLFAPIFIAFFKKEGNFYAALFSISFGFVSFVFYSIFPFSIPKELLCVFISFLGYGLGEYVFAKKAVSEKL
ncbi:MAG: sodium:pantothenate symporter [Chlamydia sp. 32-24]|nr:MAG: sodium:pantothenate symporter [Chlamydia sp. 32-24]